MDGPLTPAHYSRSWAENVIKQVAGKYPRATEDVKKILDITDRNLAAYLASGDPLWPKLRLMVQIAANWESRANWQGWTPSNVRYLAIEMRRKGSFRLADRIDKVRNQARIQEQGSGEGNGGS